MKVVSSFKNKNLPWNNNSLIPGRILVNIGVTESLKNAELSSIPESSDNSSFHTQL